MQKNPEKSMLGGLIYEFDEWVPGFEFETEWPFELETVWPFELETDGTLAAAAVTVNIDEGGKL